MNKTTIRHRLRAIEAQRRAHSEYQRVRDSIDEDRVVKAATFGGTVADNETDQMNLLFMRALQQGMPIEQAQSYARRSVMALQAMDDCEESNE